ncbi:hypothetical protein [Catenovulum maritimum]|uniref:hypothetical protein n=1 Tax=Catenovulum maritimum TaxID=1513271 RepID=UPI0012B51C83|nr:hypothetical protein [Catenovulum maritimum]
MNPNIFQYTKTLAAPLAYPNEKYGKFELGKHLIITSRRLQIQKRAYASAPKAR